MAEDERTATAKADKTEVRKNTIDNLTIKALQNRRQASPNLHETPRTEFAQRSRGQPRNF